MKMKVLKIATLNVRGLHDHSKRRKLFHWLKQLNYDIVFLQETYCTQNFVKVFNSTWDGKFSMQFLILRIAGVYVY